MARYGNPNAFASPYEAPAARFTEGLNSIAATMVAKDWTRRLPSGPKARVAKTIVAEITRLLTF